MTPRKDDIPTIKWAKFCVKVFTSEGFETQKPCSVLFDERGRAALARMIDGAMADKVNRYIQAYVLVDDKIVGLELYGKMLWLDRVPPTKYWLNYNTRPAKKRSNIAPCGLPIPSRYMEAENETAVGAS